MYIHTLSSWMCEGKELSGKKETSPFRKRDTALEAVCAANLMAWNTQKETIQTSWKIRETDYIRKVRNRQEVVAYLVLFQAAW